MSDTRVIIAISVINEQALLLPVLYSNSSVDASYSPLLSLTATSAAAELWQILLKSLIIDLTQEDKSCLTLVASERWFCSCYLDFISWSWSCR